MIHLHRYLTIALILLILTPGKSFCNETATDHPNEDNPSTIITFPFLCDRVEDLYYLQMDTGRRLIQLEESYKKLEQQRAGSILTVVASCLCASIVTALLCNMH